jgi:hypothetical protein
MERCCRVVSSFHICQKKTLLHKNKHDARYKYVKTWGQNNDNQDERSYNLKIHMERNENPTYMHDMNTKTKSKNTQYM